LNENPRKLAKAKCCPLCGIFVLLDSGLRRNDGEAVDKRTFVLYDVVVVLHVDSHDLVRE